MNDPEIIEGEMDSSVPTIIEKISKPKGGNNTCH